MNRKYVVFFIGTVAEYIKLFPVMEAVKKRNLPYKVIASGQNEIITTDIAKATELNIDLQLSSEKDIVKNVFGIFSWFFRTLSGSKKKILAAFDDVDFESSIMVVHGDTLSTVMGAVLARRLGMRLGHVEAGLRSGHLLTPFPEEIDRLYVSTLTDYNYCQGVDAVKNLKNSKGEIIDTGYNTILDAASYAESLTPASEINSLVKGSSYCIFVIHRQENLLQSKLVEQVVNKAIEVSMRKKVVFVMHQITENTLRKLNLYNKLAEQDNILMVRRVEYFDFMKLLIGSDFVITDGGSNQEELSYLGKPTLILRKATERREGIGSNAVMYEGHLERINTFIDSYEQYIRPRIETDVSPSEIICKHLEAELNK